LPAAHRLGPVSGDAESTLLRQQLSEAAPTPGLLPVSEADRFGPSAGDLWGSKFISSVETVAFRTRKMKALLLELTPFYCLFL
jgi:hypothetical protein